MTTEQTNDESVPLWLEQVGKVRDEAGKVRDELARVMADATSTPESLATSSPERMSPAMRRRRRLAGMARAS